VGEQVSFTRVVDGEENLRFSGVVVRVQWDYEMWLNTIKDTDGEILVVGIDLKLDKDA
jgi:hypothetical protein